MISGYPAGFQSELMPEDPFSCFGTGFTPWDCPYPGPETVQSSLKPVVSNSSSEGSGQNHAGSGSNSDDQTGTVTVVDERKRRRMISNRESARRSRMRKQKHLENLRNQVNRLRIENRELANRLRFVSYHCDRVRTENDLLRSERYLLQQKLLDMQQILLLQQHQNQHFVTSPWPCNTLISSEQLPR